MQELITYARNKTYDPTGVLVARKDDDNTVIVGWSAYHEWDEVRPFSKEEALRIARDRIVKKSNLRVPRRLRALIPSFSERCRKYFRTDCVIVAGDVVASLG